MPSASLLGPFTDVAGEPMGPPAEPSPAAVGPKVLGFNIQSQEQTNWCWAAVASSVCGYYASRGEGAPQSQCQIATQFLGLECCIDPLPPPSDNWAGNKTFTLELPLDVLGHFAPPMVTGSLDLASIVREIDGGRPICCHIDWGGAEGHFVVMIGYDSVHGDVIVRDPAGTIVNGTLPFKSGGTFPGGKWSETYLTK